MWKAHRGVVHAPFLGQTFLGARGLGARVRTDGRVVEARVSGRPVEQAVVGTASRKKRYAEAPILREAMHSAAIQQLRVMALCEQVFSVEAQEFLVLQTPRTY